MMREKRNFETRYGPVAGGVSRVGIITKVPVFVVTSTDATREEGRSFKARFLPGSALF